MSAAVVLPDFSAALAKMPLEWRLCDRDTFGLTTASPLQRAICRIVDGRPLRELAREPTLVAALKDNLGTLEAPKRKPREFTLLSGVRAGKSLFVACLAVHASQVCDVSRLGPGEIPRVSIVSLKKDLADVIFDHIVGRLQESPILRSLVVGKPVAERILLRHPTGRLIEVMVVAGARAGASLVARWSAGCIFDEFPRMVGGDDAVVNWDDSRKAVLLRLLPGAQIVNVGSPWAPYGPAYDTVNEHWGHPTPEHVVMRAPAYDMNPVYWTPEEVDKARRDPDVFRTDVLAEFSTPEEALYSGELLTKAIRPQAEREPGQVYTAAMDPATRGNAWTFGVFTRTGKRKRMVFADERAGSRNEPLSPRAVFRDLIAPTCLAYGITSVDTDQYYVDALQDIAREFGLVLVQTPLTEREKTERYLGIRTKLEEGEIEIPEAVQEDLQRVKKRVTQAGVKIVLPVTSDERHCDYAPTVMLGLGRYLRDTDAPKKEDDPEVVRMRNAALRRFGRPREDD